MAACPNKNSEEWKELVDKVGSEIEATYLFIKNNYEIPSDPDEVRTTEGYDFSSSAREEVFEFNKIVNVRDQLLQALGAKYNAHKGTDNKQYLTDLKKLIEDFKKADIEAGMHIFLNNAHSKLESLDKKMSAQNNDLGVLHTMNSFAGTFGLIDQITPYLDNPILEFDEETKKSITSINGKVKRLHSKYIGYARKTLVHRLAAESTIERTKRKEKLKKDFVKNNPRKDSGLNESDYIKAQTDYVEKALNDLANDIRQAEIERIRELLVLAPDDIDTITKNIMDPRGVNESIIQLTVKMLDKADFDAKESFINSRRSALSVWEKFKDSRNAGGVITDQKKLYEDIIEKIDGKETQYYTRPLFSTYYIAKDEMWEEYNKLKDEGKKKEAKKVLKDWKNKYLIDKKGKFIPSNTKPEFHNPQYKTIYSDSTKKEMYNFLVAFNNESDSMVRGKNKLEYKLPSISQRTAEKIIDSEGGIIEVGKEWWKDSVQGRIDDEQFGNIEQNEDGTIKVLTDQFGKPLKRIAVPFRGDIEITNQSYDLMGMSLTNRYASLNFKEKDAIKKDLEVLSDVVSERDVRKTSGDKVIMKTLSSIPGISTEEINDVVDTIPGRDSNTFELLTSLLEDRLYGKHRAAISEMDIKLDKLSDKAIQASSHMMLIANLLGGTSNLIAGKTMNFLESTRSIHFNTKNLAKAEELYWGDIGGIVRDMGSLAPSSMTGMLIEKFIDTSMDFSPLSNHLTKDTKFKRLFNMGTLHGINSSAEHYIQGSLMFSALDNIKVVDKETGKYVTSKGQLTDNRDEAAGMYYGYTSENGLKWNHSYTIEGQKEVTPEVEQYVNSKTKDIIADLQGMYDGTNKSMIEREWYGKLAFYLRKWMVRGTLRRWRGIQHASKELDELEDHQRFYSESTQDFKEGTYTSLARFFINTQSRIRKMQWELMRQDWDSLSDMEKGNIKAAATEIAVMVGSLIASNFLAGLAKKEPDEEDKELLYTYAYLLLRTSDELRMYTGTDIPEMSRVMRSPTATLNTLEQSWRSLSQISEDFFYRIPTGEGLEEYEGGRHKGESKSWVQVNRMINPFYKNWYDKNAQKSYDFLKNPR